jgi:hydroxymethylpyrimidine/phosphomethylpyrimidine kinase
VPKRTNIPVALTIAGSDSGGGAGIQADLKTFAALGVHGTSAVTCVTAQNPRRVAGIQPIDPKMVHAQIAAVCNELHPAAIKTGMLFSAAIIRAVAAGLKQMNRVPLVVDPVMIATSGARLLNATALKALQNELLPLATIVTPNVDEAVVLAGMKLQTVEDLRAAAREIRRRYGCAVLVKGGHLKHLSEAVDILYDGKNELMLSAPFVKGVSTHGTGCTYAAAIAAYLAIGCELPTAVSKAKQFVTGAIANSRRAGKHWVLNHFWRKGHP